MAGELCRLFSRNSRLNLCIYILIVIFVCISCGMFIHGKTQSDTEHEKYWVDRAWISGAVGLIVISFLVSCNYIMFEFEFKKKCNVLESYLQTQFNKLSEKLQPDNITSDMSRAAADSFVSSLKTKLKEAITTRIHEEFPDINHVGNLFSLLGGNSVNNNNNIISIAVVVVVSVVVV